MFTFKVSFTFVTYKAVMIITEALATTTTTMTNNSVTFSPLTFWYIIKVREDHKTNTKSRLKEEIKKKLKYHQEKTKYYSKLVSI